MARDIRHFLDDRDFVEAAAEPWQDRARRAIRRNRLAFGSGIAIAACLVAATVISLRFALASERSREEAERTTHYLTREVFGNLGETVPIEPGAQGMDVSVRRVLDVAKSGQSLLTLDPRVKTRVLGAIGQAYLKLGVFDEARSTLLDALGSNAITDAAFVESLKSDLQEIEMRTGPSDAEVLRKAQAHYESCVRAFGREDVKTIDALNLLAGALKNIAGSTPSAELARQRLDQAESYYADVLQGRKSEGSALDCFIAEHNINLVALARARRIRDSHSGESSEQLFEAVLGPRRTLTRRMERDLGPDHWQTLASRAEELTLLMLAGHNDEALHAYPELIREMRARLGFLNWRTVDATAQWARSLRVAKRYREAGSTYLLAFESSVMTRPPWHPDSRNCLLGLVGCSELAGDYEAALIALRRGLKASFDARNAAMSDEDRRLCERYQRELASRMLAMFQ
jgi:tetratricopeptide (TPR) repeat protein